MKVTIAIVGSDEDGDGVYETTADTKTATAGDMVFTYTINDDDPLPNAFFKNLDATDATESGSVTEAGTADIVVKLSAASERDIKLYYSDNGSGDATSALDYTAIADYTPITITGNAGTTEATIQVVTADDDIDEGANDLSTDYQTVEIKLYTTDAVSASMATVSNALASSSNSAEQGVICLLYTSPSPRDQRGSRMPSSA